MHYFNITPRWVEILPTWKLIVSDAVKVKKPEQIERFFGEMSNMAIAADNANDLVAYLKSKGYTPSSIHSAICLGRNILEAERNTVHEEA